MEKKDGNKRSYMARRHGDGIAIPVTTARLQWFDALSVKIIKNQVVSWFTCEIFDLNSTDLSPSPAGVVREVRRVEIILRISESGQHLHVSLHVLDHVNVALLPRVGRPNKRVGVHDVRKGGRGVSGSCGKVTRIKLRNIACSILESKRTTP